MRIQLAYVAAAILGIVLAVQDWAQTQSSPPASTFGFEGYWLGIDPTDGGDARRSLMRRDDGRFALAARDSVLTLCGGTDRGFASFDDGQLTGRNTLQSDTLTIRCFNNGMSVLLQVRFELVSRNLMLEYTTRPDGSPVSTIVFHRVSET